MTSTNHLRPTQNDINCVYDLRGAVPYNDPIAGLASTRGVHAIPRVPTEKREAFDIVLQHPTNRELFRNVYESKRWVSASFQRPTAKAIECMKRIAGDWLRGENLTPISIYQDDADVVSDPDKRRLMDGRHRLAALTQFMAGHLPALIIYEDKPCERVGHKMFHIVQWWYDKVDGRDSNLVDRAYFENEGKISIDKMRLQGWLCYDCGQKARSVDEGSDARMWPFGYEEHAICYDCWEEKAEKQLSLSQEREEGEICEIEGRDREFMQTKKVGGFKFHKDNMTIYNKVLPSEQRAIFERMKSTVFYYHKLHNEDHARKEFEQISVLSTPFTPEDQMRTLLQSSNYGMHIYEIVRPVAEFLCTCASDTDKKEHGVDVVEDALSRSKGKQLSMAVTLLMQCWYKARNYFHEEFDANDCMTWYGTKPVNMVKSALDMDMEELRQDKYKYIDRASEYLNHSINKLRRVLVMRADGRAEKLLLLSDVIKLVDIFSDEITLRYLSRADYIDNREQFLNCLEKKLRFAGKEKTMLKGNIYVPKQNDAFEEKKRVTLGFILDIDGRVSYPEPARRGTKRARTSF